MLAEAVQESEQTAGILIPHLGQPNSWPYVQSSGVSKFLIELRILSATANPSPNVFGASSSSEKI